MKPYWTTLHPLELMDPCLSHFRLKSHSHHLPHIPWIPHWWLHIHRAFVAIFSSRLLIKKDVPFVLLGFLQVQPMYTNLQKNQKPVQKTCSTHFTFHCISADFISIFHLNVLRIWRIWTGISYWKVVLYRTDNTPWNQKRMWINRYFTKSNGVLMRWRATQWKPWFYCALIA